MNDQELIKTVGENLKKVRIMQGLRLEEVASMAKVSVSMLSMIETGKRQPSLSTLNSICKSLMTNIPDMFEGVNNDLSNSKC